MQTLAALIRNAEMVRDGVVFIAVSGLPHCLYERRERKGRDDTRPKYVSYNNFRGETNLAHQNICTR